MESTSQLISRYQRERKDLLEQVALMESGKLTTLERRKDITRENIALAKRRLAEIDAVLARLADES